MSGYLFKDRPFDRKLTVGLPQTLRGMPTVIELLGARCPLTELGEMLEPIQERWAAAVAKLESGESAEEDVGGDRFDFNDPESAAFWAEMTISTILLNLGRVKVGTKYVAFYNALHNRHAAPGGVTSWPLRQNIDDKWQLVSLLEWLGHVDVGDIPTEEVDIAGTGADVGEPSPVATYPLSTELVLGRPNPSTSMAGIVTIHDTHFSLNDLTQILTALRDASHRVVGRFDGRVFGEVEAAEIMHAFVSDALKSFSKKQNQMGLLATTLSMFHEYPFGGGRPWPVKLIKAKWQLVPLLEWLGCAAPQVAGEEDEVDSNDTLDF